VVSPSGKGIKLFFLVAADDVREVLHLFGTDAKIGKTKTRKTRNTEAALVARIGAMSSNGSPSPGRRAGSVENGPGLCVRIAGRRVTKLYGAGRLFACRHCYQLAYASQQRDRPKQEVRDGVLGRFAQMRLEFAEGQFDWG
jgi:hypothetical protein